VDELRKEIGEGKYKNWDEIHNVYSLRDETYQLDKGRHAWAVMSFLLKKEIIQDTAIFKKELDVILETRRWIDKQIYESRAKDYRNPFRKTTYRNMTEMEQVLGKPGDNPFIKIIRKKTSVFTEMIERIKNRI
jgi:hypothetical protein